MVDPDALRYLRIVQADLDEAQRMVMLSGFRNSSIGFEFNAGSTPREAWLPSPTTSSL